MRGVGFPRRGKRVTLLSTIAADLRQIGERRKLFPRAVAAAAHQRRIGKLELSRASSRGSGVRLPSQLVRPKDWALPADARVNDVAAAGLGRRKARRLRAAASEWNDASPATADAASKRFFERELRAHAELRGDARDGAQHRRRTACEDHVGLARARQRVGNESGLAASAVVGRHDQLASRIGKALRLDQQLARFALRRRAAPALRRAAASARRAAPTRFRRRPRRSRRRARRQNNRNRCRAVRRTSSRSPHRNSASSRVRLPLIKKRRLARLPSAS